MAYQIGIDVGAKTGVGITENGRIIELHTVKIHKAMQMVLSWHERTKSDGTRLVVYVEDARQRKWFGNNEHKVQAKQQGAGSIKRDSTIWDDFLTDLGVEYHMIAPKHNRTKRDHVAFCKLTGWINGQTSEHSRDAAMLVFGRKGGSK